MQQHLTGYADDISVHKTIRSRKDLTIAHELIQALLAAVGRLRLRVNPVKCSIMVRLSGTAVCHEAPHLLVAGRLRRAQKASEDRHHEGLSRLPGLKVRSSTSALSSPMPTTKCSRYATDQRKRVRKIQQVRRYIYNRRIASPAARLRVWFATVWATAVTGLPEVGLSPESARHHKDRSVLNQPAHVTHVTTADLLKLHKLQDPVDKIIRRMKGRITKLRKRSRTVADAAADVALHSHILIDLDNILREAQEIPAATPATLQPAHNCHVCRAAFDKEHGLRMHISKMHRDTLSRFIPPVFDRELHAKEGMPVCAACNKSFKQWKGLRDHLLSGACSAPDALRITTSSGTLSNSSSDLLQLQELRREVQSSLSTQLAKQAAAPSAQILQNRCVVCGFWTPDHTKVKSHLRQAHPQVWQEVGEAAGQLCAGHSAQTIKGQSCPFCRRKVHDKKKHPQQCVVLFQVCLCWLRTHPPSKHRGLGPSAPVIAGTRSLRDFFAPQAQRAVTASPQVEPEPPALPHATAEGGTAVAERQSSVAVRTMLEFGQLLLR